MAHENTWEQKGVVKRFEGFMGAKEFVRAAAQVAADERFDNLRYIINDFRNVNGTDICEQTIEDVAVIHAGSVFNNPNICIAFVTTDKALATIAGRIKEKLFGEQHEMKTFATMADARAWLNSQPSLFSRIHTRRY